MAAKRFLRLIALFAVPALLLTACPADEPEDDPVVTDPEPEEPEDDTPDDPDPVDDDGLRLGYLLPETGPLAFLGPAQISAVEMAIAEINEAGGVLGNDVQLSSGDEAGDAAVASQSVDSLLADNVHAIIGAAASGMSLAVIDKIVGAGVVQCSASNTSPTFTTYDHGGYYFRTAPSDALQGPVLGETIAADGHSTVAILARADDYGQGLADHTQGALEDAGAEVTDVVIYDPEAATFSAEVEQATAGAPDAIAVIAFDEGVQLIQELLEAGVSADQLYGADGIRDTGLADSVDPGNPNVLDGMKGTAPDPGADPTFLDRFAEFAPDTETIFAAQAYDCTNLVALAAVAGGSVDSDTIAANLVDLTRGDSPCSGFAECAELLEAGESINYQAASGLEEMTDDNEPNGGTYEVWAFEDGELVTLSTVDSFLE
jgi:ABC-type branched-subunit amino acid transport system substrate-binding protein